MERPAANRHQLLWTLIGPSFIYGTIIVTAVMVVADDTQPDVDVFLVVLASVVIVWIAHTFSELVAGGPRATDVPIPTRTVLRHALDGSAGLLTSATLPLLFLLLGAFGVLEEYLAYYLAIGAAILSLAIVGWLSVQRRGYGWRLRVAGALATTLAGALVVILKALEK
ncbi:MAG: hypothetical protein M3N46_06050 [Actinomycetota bacterium]|nr:hypothetical protein [Actinomycetota bacterium]